MSRMIEISLPPLTHEQESRLWEVWADLWFQQAEDHWLAQRERWFIARLEQVDHSTVQLAMIARQLLLAVFCVDVSLGFKACLRVLRSGVEAEEAIITYRDLARWHMDCQGCDDPLCQLPDCVPISADLLCRFLVHVRDRGSRATAHLAENLLQRAEGLGSMRALVPEVIELLGDKERQALLATQGTAGREELEDETALLRQWLTLVRRMDVPLPLVGHSSVEVGARLLTMLAAETWAGLQSYRLPCWHMEPHDTWVCEACEAIRALKQGIAAQLRKARALARECVRLWTLVPLPSYEAEFAASIDLMAWADAQTVVWVMSALEWIPQEEASLARWATREITRLWESSWSEYGLSAPESSLPADKMAQRGARYTQTFLHALRDLGTLAPVESLRCTSPTPEPFGALPTNMPAYEDW
jgi:hypothetical protein